MTLQQAIDRSRSHNERVSVEFAGERSELMVALDGLYNGEIDDATENDGTIDVWGWTEDMPEGEMDWRLCVTLSSETELKINDRVEGGQHGTEDYDTGRVVAIDGGDQVTVAWDSLVETTQHKALLKRRRGE